MILEEVTEWLRSTPGKRVGLNGLVGSTPILFAKTLRKPYGDRRVFNYKGGSRTASEKQPDLRSSRAFRADWRDSELRISNERSDSHPLRQNPSVAIGYRRVFIIQAKA